MNASGIWPAVNFSLCYLSQSTVQPTVDLGHNSAEEMMSSHTGWNQTGTISQSLNNTLTSYFQPFYQYYFQTWHLVINILIVLSVQIPARWSQLSLLLAGLLFQPPKLTLSSQSISKATSMATLGGCNQSANSTTSANVIVFGGSNIKVNLNTDNADMFCHISWAFEPTQKLN